MCGIIRWSRVTQMSTVEEAEQPLSHVTRGAKAQFLPA